MNEEPHVPNPLFCVFAICSVPSMHKEQEKVTQMCTLYVYVYSMHILDSPPSDYVKVGKMCTTYTPRICSDTDMPYLKQIHSNWIV